jgi:hypothetical protein
MALCFGRAGRRRNPQLHLLSKLTARQASCILAWPPAENGGGGKRGDCGLCGWWDGGDPALFDLVLPGWVRCRETRSTDGRLGGLGIAGCEGKLET